MDAIKSADPDSLPSEAEIAEYRYRIRDALKNVALLKMVDKLCAQAKRANELAAEVERLRKENGEYNGDVAEATAHYRFQLRRAEYAERRLAVAVGALKMLRGQHSSVTSHQIEILDAAIDAAIGGQ
jgi:predicted RNase H-like nuclease (RuvC/YqgF family)